MVFIKQQASMNKIMDACFMIIEDKSILSFHRRIIHLWYGYYYNLRLYSFHKS